MRHFVGYHNADEMGEELGWMPDEESYGFWSRKPVSLLNQAKGNRVWAIDGATEAGKKIYRLWGYYIADTLNDLGNGRFHVDGKIGFIFDDPIELDGFEWFPELKLRQGNFGFGVNEIKDENAIAGLMQIEVTQQKKFQAVKPTKRSKQLDAFQSKCVLPEEITDKEEIYNEGAASYIAVNSYERSARARRKCIEHYGLSCSACGLNFKQAYGDAAEGIIHVHHLKPLSEIREEYKVDPITDLRPICPNCHAVIHSSYPMFTIEEVKKMLRRK